MTLLKNEPLIHVVWILLIYVTFIFHVEDFNIIKKYLHQKLCFNEKYPSYVQNFLIISTPTKKCGKRYVSCSLSRKYRRSLWDIKKNYWRHAEGYSLWNLLNNGVKQYMDKFSWRHRICSCGKFWGENYILLFIQHETYFFFAVVLYTTWRC